MKKFIFFGFVLIGILTLLYFSCDLQKETECFAMDTVISMKAIGRTSEKALQAATDEIYRLHRLFSITDANSDISKLNRGDTNVSEETVSLIDAALSISSQTEGAYDCTISPAVSLWGWYDDTTSIPDANALSDVMESVGWQNVRTENGEISFLLDGMAIDLGGIAKGYAAKRVGDVLTDHGIKSALIDLGGNIRVLGKKTNGKDWVIGIDDPTDKSAYLATVSVSDCSVVSSGSYQRYFEENGKLWHHILDPKIGYPADNGLVMVSIVCEDDVLADGLSTALFVMGKENAISFWRSGTYHFDAIFVEENNTISITEGLLDKFSCESEYEVILH